MDLLPKKLLIKAVLVVFSLIIFVFIGTTQAMPYGQSLFSSCRFNSCQISLSTTGSVSLPVAVDSSGVYTIANDTITVTANSPEGFEVTLESDSLTEASLEDGSNSIPASAGTALSPQTLAMNTWGYRVDGQSGFGAGPTSPVNSVGSSSLTFAGLTVNGTPTQVYSSNVAAPTGIPIDIWYGVRADSTQPAGVYNRTVIYTAISAL